MWGRGRKQNGESESFSNHAKPLAGTGTWKRRMGMGVKKEEKGKGNRKKRGGQGRRRRARVSRVGGRESGAKHNYCQLRY